jgi:hypothetical protein
MDDQRPPEASEKHEKHRLRDTVRIIYFAGAVVFLIVMRCAPSWIVPELTRITALLRENSSCLSEVRQRIGRLEPVAVKLIPTTDSSAVLSGVAEVDAQGDGPFANIAQGRTPFTVGEMVRVTNLESYGKLSVELPVRGTFESEREDVILQLSKEAASAVKFPIKKGRTTVVVWSMEPQGVLMRPAQTKARRPR